MNKILKRLFGRNEKTPVAAGVSINNDEESNMARLASATANGKMIPAYKVSAKTPFPKHLRWKIGTQSVEWETITPEMAATMLEYNTENRPCSPGTVKQYAELIRAGRWGVGGNGTCEPIIFSDLPRLLSGQHRLQAIVEAGVPQRMLVVFGEPDGNFAYIDQGRRRTSGDIFAIYKVPNYVQAAAASAWIWKYENNKFANTPPSPQELYEFYLQHEGLQGSMAIGRAFQDSGLAPPSMMIALHYLCARKNRKLADEFFRQVAEGVGITSKRTPAYKLRKKLLNNQASASAKLSNLLIAAFTVKSWNALRDGRALGVLKWRTEQSPSEPFPRIK